MMGTGKRVPDTVKGKKAGKSVALSAGTEIFPVPGPRSPGVLYVVATPIGNLEDMTYRAVRILREADLIAAEDTRHTRKLLTHFGISRPITSYFDHNAAFKGEAILERLKGGDSVALVSDAGTPCISDPGYQLVHDAAAAGISVVPIPGPSAATAALSVSGLPNDTFTFVGFLPNRSSRRRERLESLRQADCLLIFYEAPHRLAATVADMAEIFGDRPAVIGREITKLHEEFIRGTLLELSAALAARQVRGESVILVVPAPPAEETEIDWPHLLRSYLAAGMTVKDAARRVALETKQPRSSVYQEALGLAGDE
jgi:16S rRNA (cytidine1402-2'-O)-methyltransferase